MALLMLVATVYGVGQVAILASPTRSVRISTVLLTVAVGIYGSGVGAALFQLAYTRGVVSVTGDSLPEVVDTASYTVDPVIEELLKIAPLLLVACNIRIRRQWGLTDYVVLGAGLGAGFGLLESMARYALDADRAISVPAGGWIIPDSLSGTPYVPGPEQLVGAWFPAPTGTLGLGDHTPTIGTSPHLVQTVLAALGIAVLVRGRRWMRLLGLVPVAAAVTQHIITNYAAAHPTDQDAVSRADSLDGVLWAVPLACLAIAMTADLRQLRRGKKTVPGVLVRGERHGRSGTAALAAYGGWCVPWSALIALRFARLRRSLLYAAARGPYPGWEPLHRTVWGSAAQIDASDHEAAWQDVTWRSVCRAARAGRDRRRTWLILIPCLLTLPALAFLVVGSFPAAADIQEWFGTGQGPAILMGLGVVGLVWIAVRLALLLHQWTTTGSLVLGEALAVIRFRVWTAVGSAIAGLLLLARTAASGSPARPVIHNLHLLDALDQFLAYLGFALMLLALLALFPPGGGLALASTGVAAGTLTAEAAVHAAALGTLGIVLMTAGDGAGVSSSGESPTSSGGEEINWSPKSTKTFGHTFKTHGQRRNLEQLIDRARGKGSQQGQWLDDSAAAEAMRRAYRPGLTRAEESYVVEIPKGTGRVILEDGTWKEATHALIVPARNGLIKTAYPIIP